MASASFPRLPLALGLSLLFHLLLLLLPPGTGGWPVGHRTGTSVAGDFSLAPLEVVLGPNVASVLPNATLTGAVTGLPKRQSVMVDSGAVGRGELGAARADVLGHTALYVRAGIPVDHYFAPEELSQRARILQGDATFLQALEELPGHGKAVIALWINERGEVDRHEMESSDLGSTLESALLGEFSATRFIPAERDGIPVKSRMRYEVEVRPRSRFSRSEEKESSPSL